MFCNWDDILIKSIESSHFNQFNGNGNSAAFQQYWKSTSPHSSCKNKRNTMSAQKEAQYLERGITNNWGAPQLMASVLLHASMGSSKSKRQKSMHYPRSNRKNNRANILRFVVSQQRKGHNDLVNMCRPHSGSGNFGDPTGMQWQWRWQRQ